MYEKDRKYSDYFDNIDIDTLYEDFVERNQKKSTTKKKTVAKKSSNKSDRRLLLMM